MNKTGKVVRWEADRGFGFIRSPNSSTDVFFHIREFKGPGEPRPGQMVDFEEIHVGGKGPRAMAVRPVGASPVATPARTTSPPRRAVARPSGPAPHDSWLMPVLLAGLIWAAVLAWAASVGRLPPWTLPIWSALNAWTFLAYWRDKGSAQTGQWRTPEDTLHMWSLLGGWPLARLAQHRLRHKSRKASFQAMYWATVLGHLAAVAALMVIWPGWHLG